MIKRSIVYFLLYFTLFRLFQCNSDRLHENENKKKNYIVLSVILGTKSHAKTILYIGEEMLKRGHEVVYMSTLLSAKYAQDFNISTIVLKTPENIQDSEQKMKEFQEKLLKFRSTLTQDISIAKSISTVFNIIANDLYEKAVFGLLDAFQKRKPDLVICNFMGMACVDVCAHLNISYVVSGFSLAYFDHPELPRYIPDQHIGRSVFSINFWERLYDKFIFYPYLFTLVFPDIQKLNQIRSKYGLPTSYNPQTNLINRPILVTSFDGWTIPHLRSPLIHTVGPLIEEKELQKQIPDDLLQWLDNARLSNRPVIYVGFGSVAVPTRVHIQTLLDGFFMKSSSYRVLWSLGGLLKERFPFEIVNNDSIRFEQWVPQLKVLAHPSIKLYVTHGGIESIHEILYIGKPSMMIPFFGDQFSNAILARDRGLGDYLNKNTMTSEDVSNIVHRLLTDYENHSSQLYRNIYKMSRIVHYNRNNYKQIYNALEMEMDIGSQHLIPVSVSWIVAYDIDLWLACFLFIFIIVYVLRFICCKRLCSKPTKEKLKDH